MPSTKKETIDSKHYVIDLDADAGFDDDIASLDSDLKALGEKESSPVADVNKSRKEKSSSETTDKYPPRAMRQRTPKLEPHPTKSTSTQRKAKPEPEKKSEPVKKQGEEEEEEYEIERIEGHRIFKGKVVTYEIKWKGYPTSQNTTERANTIHADVYDLCAAYWDSLPHITRPSNAPKSIQSTSSPAVDNESSTSLKNKETQSTKAVSPKLQETSSPKKRPQANVSSTETSKRPKIQEEKPKREITPKALSPSPVTRQSSSPVTRQSSEESEKRTRKKSVEQAESEIEEEEEEEEDPNRVYARHVPDYMTELGYKFETDFPKANANWNRDIIKVCVQASPINPKRILCYAEWNNGKKTIHPMNVAHQKIPQLLIKYYEERLQFL